MIHLLQTGDLHLGKFLHGTSLLEDQKYILAQLTELINSKKDKADKYHALIITGDIYDKAIPTPEAISLFDDFLTELHQTVPELKILLISGNHDSATRLSFGSGFFEKQNIFITTNPEDCNKAIIIEGSDKDKIAFYQIPFLNAGSLTSSEESSKAESSRRLVNQQELIEEAVNRIKKAHQENPDTKNLPACLNAHLFTLGGTSSESERVFIGNAEMISKDNFDFFAYTALGHLHKPQKVSEKCYYAGSPLAYSFDEADSEKSFLDIVIKAPSMKKKESVKIKKTEKNGELDFGESSGTDFQEKDSSTKDLHQDLLVKKIPIEPLHKVTKLKGKFEDFFSLSGENQKEFISKQNDYVEITCTDNILVENPVSRLRENFPNILAIKQEAFNREEQSVNKEEKKELLNQRENLSPEKIFTEFVKDVEFHDEEKYWDTSKNLFTKIAKSLGEEK